MESGSPGARLVPVEIVYGVSGRLNQVDDLADPRFAGVATLGGDARLEAEPHEAEQDGLEDVVVVFVEGAVYERASIEVVLGGQTALTTRREGVVAVGVALSDAAVPAVDEDLAPAIASDSAGRLDRFALRVEAAGDLLRAGLSDCPFFPTRDDVLAPCCHWPDSRIELGKSIARWSLGKADCGCVRRYVAAYRGRRRTTREPEPHGACRTALGRGGHVRDGGASMHRRAWSGGRAPGTRCAFASPRSGPPPAHGPLTVQHAAQRLAAPPRILRLPNPNEYLVGLEAA